MAHRNLRAGKYGGPSLLSTAGSFTAPVGERFGPESLEGYYIDFRRKATVPSWPPPWLGEGKPGKVFVAAAQWGLGAHESFLASGDEVWLRAAAGAAEHLLEHQLTDGPLDGAWVHDFRHAHTFPLEPPWVSGMAQGEGASLLARLALRTGEERYADAARRAIGPLTVPAGRGGAAAELAGGFLPEEYPTSPPSHVLNGAIFSLWGCRDAAILIGDERAERLWREGLETLCANLDRYDTGSWSRYDLFPHPLTNVASTMYHRLHIDQLRALMRTEDRPELAATAERFERYARSRPAVGRAIARKIAFRIAVPRNELITHRLPWSRTRRG